MLGAHEGEGLVVEADAEVAGSRSALMADKGQKVRGMGDESFSARDISNFSNDKTYTDVAMKATN